MKRYILAIAAFSLALSCTKEIPSENELVLGEGTPVTVEVGAPEGGNPDEVETRITESINGKTYSFTWNAGDSFRLFFWKTETETGQSPLNDAGDFTTESGGATASFTGSLPVADEGDYKTYALYPASAFTSETKIIQTSSAPNKFSIQNINLSACQDGTGFKYCCFASNNGELRRSSSGWSFTKAPKFAMSNGIMHLKLNPALNVNKIAVTCEYPDYTGTTQLYLAGDVTYATNSTGDNSKGSEKTVIVYNGGTVLPEDVYIAVRHTVSNSTYGVCHLKFAFYNTSGDVARKTLKLAKYDTDGNVTGYVNVSIGRVYSIGTVNSLPFGTERTICWVPDAAGKTIHTVYGPEGSGYKYFPYANDSSAGSVTQITDGPTGAVLAEGSVYTESKPYEFWSDVSGADRNVIEVGCNTDRSGGYYYMPKNIYQIRIKYGYIEVPAIVGYKLTHIRATFGNAADANVYTLCSDRKGTESKALSGLYHCPVSKLTPIDADVTDALPGTAYYQCIDGDRLITGFEYTYTKVGDDPGRKAPAGTVDLGLSVFWATCNLGASKPEDAGDYYAWGSTETRYSSISGNKVILKEGHKTNSYEDYEYCIITPGESGQPADTTWTKYNGTDGKKQLDPEDDAATQILGNGWRTPTHNEWEELRNHTRCEEKKDGDTVIGYYVYSTVSGYKDKYIFIPCPKVLIHDHLNLNIENAGLWSSTYGGRSTAPPGRSYAYREMPYNAFGDGRKGWAFGQLPYSRNIRPVADLEIAPSGIDPSGSGKDFN